MELFKNFLDSIKAPEPPLVQKQVPQKDLNRQYRPDKEFFIQLVCNEDIISKNPNIELINQTVSMYRKCIEYFDSVQEPVKHYFVDKIQVALLQAKTYDIVKKGIPENEKSPSAKKKKVVQKPSRSSEIIKIIKEESSGDSSDDEMNETETLILQKKIQNSSPVTRKSMMNIQVGMKIEEDKQETDIANIMDNYQDKQIFLQKKMEEDLINQQKQHQDRLANRQSLRLKRIGQSQSAQNFSSPEKQQELQRQIAPREFKMELKPLEEKAMELEFDTSPEKNMSIKQQETQIEKSQEIPLIKSIFKQQKILVTQVNDNEIQNQANMEQMSNQFINSTVKETDSMNSPQQDEQLVFQEKIKTFLSKANNNSQCSIGQQNLEELDQSQKNN